jgi:peptidoglycan hydrolase CwlO-like protein
MPSNLITGVIATTNAAIASQPFLEHIQNDININLIIAVIAICLSAFGTLVKVFGKETRSTQDQNKLDELYKKIEKVQVDLRTIENDASGKYTERTRIVGEIKEELAVLKTKTENQNKSIDDLRKDTREIVQRLDDLLRQLIDWVNQ